MVSYIFSSYNYYVANRLFYFFDYPCNSVKYRYMFIPCMEIINNKIIYLVLKFKLIKTFFQIVKSLLINDLSG